MEKPSPILPPCCRSGCTVCVLDYPELFLDHEAESLAMLEAIEQAQEALLSQEGEQPTE